jgi:hypothetical protein
VSRAEAFSTAKVGPRLWADVQQALNLVGKVLDVSQATSTISGRVRYGLQSTRLRVSVIEESENRCLLQIQGFGDDIWVAELERPQTN